MIQPWIQVCVVAKRREAADIYSFELADPGGRPLPPFSAGAHLDVEIMPGLVRQYSLCAAPAHPDRYMIGVLREAVSRGGSIALVDTVNEGSLLRISEPRNHFALDAAASRSILIAGGIGVTPILAMAERLANTGRPFRMHYKARSRAKAAFLERISASSFADSVRLHFSDGAEDQHMDLTEILSHRRADDHLYVCGPGSLIAAVLDEARVQGWPDACVHREFFAPIIDVATLDSGAFDVKLASTGATYAIPADRSIAEVLEANGVGLSVSCEQGVCGTCLVRVLEGEPDHRDCYLMPEEQARNNQMLPCCSRAKTPLLVLDL